MASPTRWTWVWMNSGSWCCDSWGRREVDMTEQLNWTELTTFPSVLITLSHAWVLNIIQIIFSIYLDNHVVICSVWRISNVKCCLPGINCSDHNVQSLFLYLLNWFIHFLFRIFASMFMREIALLFSFFFFSAFVGFLSQSYTDLIK